MNNTAIVVVSHSKKIADGIYELMKDFTPEVNILAFGGLPDQRLGSSYSEIFNNVSNSDFENFFCFYDLGSSKLNLKRLQNELNKNIIIFDVSLIEGCFKCAVSLSINTPNAEIILQLENYKIDK